MWMNQSEIEMAYESRHACPNVRKGVRLLYRLMQSVNSQSDGWAVWNAPAKAAEPLMVLLANKAGLLWVGSKGTITADELRAVVTPIKAMVTRQKRLQKKFGNSFDFDVNAALAEAN